jgi:hypothetical protein
VVFSPIPAERLAAFDEPRRVKIAWTLETICLQVPVLSVSNARHHDPFRAGIAAQLVRYNHAGPNPRGSQQLAEKPHGRESITPRLDEDVDHNTVLINGSQR